MAKQRWGLDMSDAIDIQHRASRNPYARPLAGALLAVAAGRLAGCKSEGAQYVARPQPVRAASVTLSAAARTRSYTGTIKPRFESDLGFRVSGKIVERFINIGDMVTPGMTLARLDATDYRLSLESADAELTAAEAASPRPTPTRSATRV